MEHETVPETSSPPQAHAAHFNPSSLASDMTADGHVLLGEYQSSVPCMVGVIRASRARDDTWERHDHGDELLVVLHGAVAVTLRDTDGQTTERELVKGDVLIVRSGVAHHFTLHTDEARALFVTPRTGNTEWPARSPAAEARR